MVFNRPITIGPSPALLRPALVSYAGCWSYKSGRIERGERERETGGDSRESSNVVNFWALTALTANAFGLF